MSEDDENVAAPAAAAGKSKVLPALLVINTLLLTGVLIFVMKRPAAHAAPEVKEEGAAAEASGHGDPEAKPAEGGHGAAEAAGTGPTVRFDNLNVQL
ncbi:MAG: hypothetical protein JWP49_536, partial [Phenylobacterium sp.]|nr:hypothetical protein [Phenylobacterium sp.]